jgi:hypothetical protein
MFMMYLAIDANFRLKNRVIKNVRHYPALGAGMGYFVEPAKYKKHLKNYISEKDVSAPCYCSNIIINVDRLALALHSKRSARKTLSSQQV